MIQVEQALRGHLALMAPGAPFIQFTYALAPPVRPARIDATAECEAIKAGYAQNRAFLLDALPRIGLGDFLPVDGAFYIYLDVGRHTNDSMAFCRAALEEAGVAITPGLDFDEARGARTVRLSFAGSLHECREAVDRLEGWLKRR